MSATRRGLVLFGILVVVTAVFCVWLPFFGLPKAGFGVGLPVVSLPPETLVPKAFFGIDLTNSMTSMLLVDVLLILIGLVVRAAVSGKLPTQFVPRGFTNFIDLLVEFWYNQARNALGNFTGRVLPLALTVFTFLLVANWVKLIPGVETVGIKVCAEPGQAAYPLQDNGTFLKVDSGDLKGRAGVKPTEADALACFKANPKAIPPGLISKCQTAVDANLDPKAYPKGITADECKEVLAISSGKADSGAVPNSGVEPVSFQPGGGQPTTNQATTARSDLFTIIPYFRPLATDLNVTLALAIIVFLAVEIYGVWALGGAYFFKFINVPALGNLSKKPMGAMDFIVGLVEIISELSRLISLSFRLLGNLFAGGVLLAVMAFLVAGVLPSIFMFLELFVGAIQAYVFAILLVMYTSQAITAHHADEEHEAHGHEEAAHA